MSRIGKKTIKLPGNTEAHINNSIINIKGPKGKLSYCISKLMIIEKNKRELNIYPRNTDQKSRALHGLSRTIINNMVIGVSEGFKKQLEIHGIGYRGQMEGKNLLLNVGYSHPVIIKPPDGIDIKVENNTKITVHGINKEIVGQVAAKIRSTRAPEPYKGKGIKYTGEKIRKKVGKAGK